MPIEHIHFTFICEAQDEQFNSSIIVETSGKAGPIDARPGDSLRRTVVTDYLASLFQYLSCRT
jgi:hypothetical protein